MYKLCIALGWSVIKMQLQSAYLSQNVELWGKINQHRFIYSTSIDDYYSENAEKEGLLFEYQDYMSAVLNSDQYLAIHDSSPDINKTISDYLKKQNKSVALVICESGELTIARSSCRYQYTIDEACMDEKCLLGMYSVIASFYANEGEDARPYINWIKNIISEEKEISIIDPYLLEKQKNCQCLIDYYYPVIPPGCVVNLHVSNSSQFIDQIINTAEQMNISVKIHKYRRMNHDRFITTSNRIIGIGIGLDFMRNNRGILEIRRGTNFTLQRKRKEKSSLEEEHKLAGEIL